MNPKTKTPRQFRQTPVLRLVLGIFSSWVCGISSDPLLAQPSARPAQYLRLEEMAESPGVSADLIRELVKATHRVVAHIEAKKPKSTAGKAELSGTKTAMIEEAGSGVLIEYRNRLFVITNYHVIDGADITNIRVVVNEQLLRPVDARKDRESDLAVMLLETQGLEAAQIGNSDDIQVGDFVVAIGSPFGLSHSVSYGIISALNRHDLELGPQGVKYQDFFQTDAAINPGNSGGPLFDLKGNVIGINTAIASNSGGSDGIGFSIPINMALRIVRDMIDFGYVRRGYLGVSLSAEYGAEAAMNLGITQAYGAQITAVAAGSPADQAGLKIGDVILRIGDRKVANDSHLVTLVSLLPIDETIPFAIFRQGDYLTVSVKITQK